MDETSAGVVVLNRDNFLLLNYNQGHWGFPKGRVESGESRESAALRELKEETGLIGVLIQGFKERITYSLQRSGSTKSKEVTFFLAKVQSTQVLLSNEHKGFLWLPIKAAIAKLTYPETKEVLAKAKAWLEVNEKQTTC